MAKSNTKKLPKITVIGGGTGVFTILSGLKNYPIDLTAIITMADDGGSTGILREEFGILPPGDVRRALIALSHSDNKLLSELFNYRFHQGCLNGHAFGNIMLTALERITGNFEKAIFEAANILGVHGEVVPVTLENTKLIAELENGEIIKGETNIDIPKHNPNIKINKIFLKPQARINPKAKKNILNSDLVIIGPGDLYTSIIPNLVVLGMSETLKKTKAKKIYIVNVMTKFGETNKFNAEDFINTIEKYLGKGTIDYALINTKRPSRERLYRYTKESAEFVEPNFSSSNTKPIFGNFIRQKGFVRHDPDKVAETLLKLLKIKF